MKLVLAAAGAALLLLAALGGLPGGIYLAALVGWTALPLGALGLMAAHRLLGGEWGIRTGPVLTAAARTLPLAGLLFVPLLLFPAETWPWARPGGVPPGPGKELWFAPVPFGLRTLVYFAAWTALAAWMTLRPPHPAQGVLSLAGLAILGTLAAVDWVLSLDPSFNSSAFGLVFLAHCFAAALGFAIFTQSLVEPGRDPGRLGALLLAAVIAWAYLAYFQYLVIYTGNIPAEAAWVLRRSQGEWQIAARVLAALMVVLPIPLLMWRKVRLHPWRLAAVALMVLAGSLLHAAWLVLPEFPASGLLAPLAAMAGIGMVWIAAFLTLLAQTRR